MSDMDIRTLYDFAPKWFCQKCKAIFFDIDQFTRDPPVNRSCPVCNVEYRCNKVTIRSLFEKVMHNYGNNISYDNLLDHCQELAEIAHRFDQGEEDYPPMRVLFDAINAANKFIHFSSFGLSQIIFGALKLKAQTIPVRGIASHIEPWFRAELGQRREAPHLDIKVYGKPKTDKDWTDLPHNKLIVIDGLMAFHGSANMTNHGLRQAEKGYDNIQLTTRIKDVINLNNKYFSPIWAKSHNETSIKLEYSP